MKDITFSASANSPFNIQLTIDTAIGISINIILSEYEADELIEQLEKARRENRGLRE